MPPRPRLLPLAAAVALVAAFTAGSVRAEGLEWRTVRSDEGRYSVALPAAPRTVNGQNDTALGSISEYGVEVSLGGLWLKLQHHDLPRAGFLVLSSEGILRLAMSRLMDERHARVEHEEAFVRNGHPARALRYLRTDQGNRREEVQALIVGRRLYIATAAPGDEAADRETIARFFDSIDVWEE